MADKITYEHYVGECFVKCAHIILGSRINRESKTVSDRRTRRWFLLEVDELESAAAELDSWRRDIHAPLVLEIVYWPWGKPETPWPRDGEEPNSTGEKLLERWVLQYSKAQPAQNSGSMHRSIVDEAAVYKRMIILIRSLYSYSRVLPAYRMFRAISKRQGQGQGAIPGQPALDYRISRALPRQQRGAPSRLQQFNFAPIDTPSGCFRMSVEYQPASTVQILEQTAAPIMSSPQIIPDYIGSHGSSGQQRILRPQMSSSVYETRPGYMHLPDPSSSPPISAGAGILSGMHPRAMLPIHRQSWSSRDRPSPAISSSLRTPVKRSVSGHMAISPGASPQDASPRPPTGRPVPIGSVPPAAVFRGFMPAPQGCLQQPAAATPPPLSPFTAVCGSQQGTAASGGAPEGEEEPMDVAAEAGTAAAGAAVEGTPAFTRQASAPMKIPGRGNRVKSLADLHDLEGDEGAATEAMAVCPAAAASDTVPDAAARPAPAWRVASTSAPAAARGMLSTLLPKHGGPAPLPATGLPPAHGMHAGGHPPRPGGGAAAGHVPFPASHSSSSSSLSSAFHMSCSPQLPFAMTPSGQSLGLLGSFADQHAAFAAMGAPAAAPSPPVSGRDITPLAMIGRPSWSSRSSSFDPAAMPSALSISPLQDLMDTGLLSGSTPQQQLFHYSPASSPCMRIAPHDASRRPPREHQAGGSPAAADHLPPNFETELAIGAEESESDLLPFALDGDGLPGADSGWGRTNNLALAASTAGEERDVAIEAFIRMVQDAPPLLGGPLAEASLTMGQALSLMNEKLAHIQAVIGPDDAPGKA